MAARAAPRSLYALFKQGCTEIPEIMGGVGLLLVSYVLQARYLYDYNKNDRANHKYKLNYLIIRPDHPQVDKVHKD